MRVPASSPPYKGGVAAASVDRAVLGDEVVGATAAKTVRFNE